MFGRPPAATTGFGFGQQPTAPTNAGFSFGGQGTGIGSSPASTIGNPAAGGGIFGSSPATSSSAFGAAPNTTNTTSIGFGMAPSQQLQTSATVNNGTGNPAYSTTNEKDAIQQNQTFFAISAMPAYRNWSFEVSSSFAFCLTCASFLLNDLAFNLLSMIYLFSMILFFISFVGISWNTVGIGIESKRL